MSEVETTFAFIKPDAVAAGHTQGITQRIRQEGFDIVGQQELTLSKGQASQFYAEHETRPFYPGLIEFMTSGPVVALALRKQGAIKAWRALAGPTNSVIAKQQAPTSVRAVYGSDNTHNAVHGSDSSEAAARELKLILNYEIPTEKHEQVQTPTETETSTKATQPAEEIETATNTISPKTSTVPTADIKTPRLESTNTLIPNNTSTITNSPILEPIPTRKTSMDPKTGKPRVWAPINVPITRRRQTLAVLLWYMGAPFCILLSLWLLHCRGIWFYGFLLYVAWILLFQEFHCNGGHRSQFIRNVVAFKWFRDYFPISLHKTVDIPPTKAYIFGYHPHGIISLGAFTNFATEATGFSEKFPGINLRLLTLNSNFRIPFYGIYLTLLGICDASRESIVNIIGQGPGNACMLVLGGAKESLDAHPGNFNLTLKSRKGFVKIALETGASLVPVFGFGETDIYSQVDNPRGSKLRAFQLLLQEKLGFAIPLVKGRGVFNYSYGILPHRAPIDCYVGTPIDVPLMKKHDITQEIIDRYHNLYMAGLTTLFDEYKQNYITSKDAQLKFVD